MADEKIILQVEIDSTQTEQSITNLTDSIIDLKKAQIDLNSAVKKGEISESEYQKEIEKSKEDISKLNSERKNEIKILKAAENSIEALEATQAKLVKQRKVLNLGTAEGVEQYKKLSAQIKLNQERLTSYGEDINRHQSKVGDYKGAILEAFSSLGILNTQLLTTATTLTATTAATGKATIAMRVLKFAMAATGIGLIIAAFATLYTYFTKYDEGMEKIERISAQVGAVMNVFFERVIGFGKALGGMFTGIYEIAKNVGTIIAGLVTFDYEKITEGINGISESSAKVVNSAKDSINSFKGMTKEMSFEAKQADILTKKLQGLEDTERELKQLRAKQEKELAEARETINDKEKNNATKRLAALKLVAANEKELANLEKKFAADKYNYMNMLIGLQDAANVSDEQKNELADAYIELQAKQADSAKIIAKNLAQQRAIEKELAAERETELKQKNALLALEKLATETKKPDVLSDDEQKAIDSVKAADAAIIDSANQRESALINNAIEGADKRNAIKEAETDKAIAENERLVTNTAMFADRIGGVLVDSAMEADATLQSVMAATAEAIIQEIETYATAQLIKLILKQTADAASLNIPGAIAAGAGIIAIKAASAGIRAKIRSSVAPSAPASVPNVTSSANLSTVNRQFSSQQNINVAAPNVNVSTSTPSANEIGTAVARAVQNVPIYVSVTDINEAQTMQVKVTNNGRI